MTSARDDDIAELPFVEGRPAPETAQALRDELLFQRACQVYLWALPLINTLGMQRGSEAAFGKGYDVLPVWKGRLDARTRVTTPNSDLLYAMSYVDLAHDGPLVLDAPAGLQGILLDFWQRPIPVDGGAFWGDVGLFGPDAGKGGKFLMVPPAYDGPVPDGHHVYRSGTNNVFIFLRAFFQDPHDLAPAVAHVELARVYPLGDEAGAAPMRYPDASGVAVDMLPIRDASAFTALQGLVDGEVPLGEPDWLGMLAAIGIVRGRPFEPDARTTAILDRAARTAYRMSRAIGIEEEVGGRSYRLYPDRNWFHPFADGTKANPAGALDLTWMRTADGYRDLDARAWFFTDYYSVSPGMFSYTSGKGANYMVAFTDRDGDPLTGASSYRLRLPADVPAGIFWSLTLYEAESASGLPNGQPFPSLGSRDRPVQNEDGSTDLYVGPAAPDGREANWLATVPGVGWFTVLRLYGPLEPSFERTWVPGDFEKLP